MVVLYCFMIDAMVNMAGWGREEVAVKGNDCSRFRQYHDERRASCAVSTDFATLKQIDLERHCSASITTTEFFF